MMRKGNMKKSRIAIIVMVSILCLVLFSSCFTAARWQSQYSDTDGVTGISSVEANPSAPYIVYAALNAAGALIASDDNETDAAAYAVVGYTGLVAELVIPASYTDTEIYTAQSGTNHSLPVKKVMVVSDYADYKCSQNGASYTNDDARLANQSVVTSIVFGTNVERINAGVCNSMINLTSVTFLRSVTLEDYAFLNCASLASVTGSYVWGSATASGTAFMGCVFDPSAV